MRRQLNLIAISILSLILLGACSPKKDKTSVFWVNSIKVLADAGLATIPCMQITKQKDLKEPKWQVFYSNIEGFKLKVGYFQKVEVLETKLPEDSIPADGSSIKYTLVKVLEEKVDSKWLLNDIWALSSIKGEKITVLEGMQRPQLELHLSNLQVVGTDGCNQIMGAIKNVTTKKIEFGPLAGTLMMCPDMTVANAFNKALTETRSYKIVNLELILFNGENKELLRLKKID